MTRVTLKTGEDVWVNDIIAWIEMSDEEFEEWEANNVGKHEYELQEDDAPED